MVYKYARVRQRRHFRSGLRTARLSLVFQNAAALFFFFWVAFCFVFLGREYSRMGPGGGGRRVFRGVRGLVRKSSGTGFVQEIVRDTDCSLIPLKSTTHRKHDAYVTDEGL